MSFRVLFRGLLLISAALLFAACPPPAYQVGLQLGDQVSKKLVIAEDSLRIEICGSHTPFMDRDWIYLDFHFEGMQISDKNSCENAIAFKSNKFILERPEDFFSTGPGDCFLDLHYHHRVFKKMTIAEARDYLDSTSLAIILQFPSGKTREIQVRFNRDWIVNEKIPKEHWEALK